VDQAEVDKAKAARQSITVNEHDAVRAAFDVLDCAAPDPLHGKDDPTLPLITCDPVLPAKYALEPAFLTGGDVEHAQARIDQNTGQWVVDVTFRSEGTRAWADFTTKNVGQQVAVVVDARVVSAPEIREAIMGGATVISGGVGGFSKQDAEDLARNLGSR
jgi:preprotein translocase subunit SecD